MNIPMYCDRRHRTIFPVRRIPDLAFAAAARSAGMCRKIGRPRLSPIPCARRGTPERTRGAGRAVPDGRGPGSRHSVMRKDRSKIDMVPQEQLTAIVSWRKTPDRRRIEEISVIS